MLKNLLFAACLAVTPALVHAADASGSAARMDEVVRADADTGQFMGAVLVAKDGAVLFDKGYGAANLEWSQPNDGETRFRLGSLSKQFTAAATLLLVEDGKLALDKPVSTWLPDAPASWAKITPRHLLNHTSGLHSFTALPDYAALNRQRTDIDGVIGRFRELPLDFQPGEGWNYSNSGYAVLTKLIEVASGQAYADFVTARLFKPIGMTASGYDRAEAIIPHRAAGYVATPEGIQLSGYADMTVPQGAGGLYSTTHDLLVWEQALFGGKVLKPASFAALTTPAKNDYAMGLIIEKQAEGTRIWHNGGIDGFNTYMAWDPERKIAVVVLGNLMSMAPDRIGRKLMAVASGETVVLPSEHKAIPFPAEELPAYAGTYQLAPGFDIAVTVKDGALLAQGTGQPAIRLTPEAKNRFYAADIDAVITFDQNVEGEITGLVLTQGGRDMPAPRQR